jgi:protein arginine kinase
MLLEEHLISPDFSAGGKGRAVVLSRDGRVSIMVNEEDHLRIQSLLPGLQLLETRRMVDEIDERLSLHLDFAFLENWGYLTACPTNVGTAMRASVMMHLPGLVMTKRMREVVDFLSERGTAVRGLFGEGTRALGNLYQISNQVTLGESEEEIITELSEVCREVVKEEEKARKTLLREDEMGFLDRVYRALGTLSYAKKVSFEEAIELLSTLRLGVETGLLPPFDGIDLNELMFRVRPAHLQNFIKKSLPEEEQDVARASLIKEKLNLQSG